ncbi:hypothetical protein ACIBH1_26480 [Nonomuraea sp. NPDC050663]|uniref:hypothetical protein n=1 Tax=Nonomuraea sp. NPDC050663 TaxID=3364370 RepID=UPI0037A8A62E
MPTTVRTAQLLIFLQAAFSLLSVGLIIAGIGTDVPLVVLLMVAVNLPWIVAGWLAGRWRAPRPWHLGAAIALQVAGLALGDTMRLLDGEELSSLLDVTLVAPAAVVVLLILPASRAWFRERVGAVPPMGTAPNH